MHNIQISGMILHIFRKGVENNRRDKTFGKIKKFSFEVMSRVLNLIFEAV